MLEKIEVVDLIEIVENGLIQIRTRTAIKEDDVEISSKFHRHVVSPIDDYSQEDPKVQAICAAVHTPEVVAAYQAELDRIAAYHAEQVRIAAEQQAMIEAQPITEG